MARRFHTRWVITTFFVLGALLAVWLIVRGIHDEEPPGEDGTTPREVTLGQASERP